MKGYQLTEFGIDGLHAVDLDMPAPGSGEVLVRLRAASLNYRDLMMVKGLYNPRLSMPMVPLSDGAGEVAAVGEGVDHWKVGDRVIPNLAQGWIGGPVDASKARTTLGGDLDGTLREYGLFSAKALVRIPQHLDFDEASTLPCAALTAYNALFVSARLEPGETVLIQGTGGVSIFALQFAKAAGARVILISSSEEKLERAKRLGADETINYRDVPEWGRAVREMTGKRGVDHVVEVGGAGTMQQSLDAVRIGGHIAVIGVLAGKGSFDLTSVLMKSVRLQGLFVGSVEMFESMNRFIAEKGIKPVIGEVFSFEATQDALRCLESQSHFGKIVIRF